MISGGFDLGDGGGGLGDGGGLFVSAGGLLAGHGEDFTAGSGEVLGALLQFGDHVTQVGDHALEGQAKHITFGLRHDLGAQVAPGNRIRYPQHGVLVADHHLEGAGHAADLIVGTDHDVAVKLAFGQVCRGKRHLSYGAADPPGRRERKPKADQQRQDRHRDDQATGIRIDCRVVGVGAAWRSPIREFNALLTTAKFFASAPV